MEIDRNAMVISTYKFKHKSNFSSADTDSIANNWLEKPMK